MSVIKKVKAMPSKIANFIKNFSIKKVIKRIKRWAATVTPGWVVVYILMIAFAAYSLLPLIYMVSTSLKPMDELYIFPPKFFVMNPTMANFKNLFSILGAMTIPFLRYVFNSIILTAAIVLGTIGICSIGAYGLSKFNIPYKNIIFSIIIAAIMFPAQVTQIPRFIIVTQFNLLNYAGIVLTSVAAAYSFFLMKQFLDQFPDQYIEAARIDGAGEFKIFTSVVMPSQAPVLSALIVFSFTAAWNDYFTPLIYVTSQTWKTLPLALQTISGGAGAASLATAGAVSAASFLMTIPTILIFVLRQRKVMETMTYSGIKG